ncbi:glycosyltransferase family 2 protein [Piromyces sp. E2]|nr:glycosyltransferase family 2 protein [Piromyces sp. E2]|eukprot:OUM68750.1 glycosyltransferase family 2 protein [Piromyces sp. E2]
MAKPIKSKNILYSFNFYAGSHHEKLMSAIADAIAEMLPIFITECSLTYEGGNGAIDYDYAVKWFGYLRRQKLGYTVLNLSNRKMSYSLIKASTGENKHLSDDDLTDNGPEEFKSLHYYVNMAVLSFGIVFVFFMMALIYTIFSKRKCWTYYQFIRKIKKRELGDVEIHHVKYAYVKRILVMALMLITIIYLTWRITFSINKDHGPIPIICNIILLLVEILGFIESCVLYFNILNIKDHTLPLIDDHEYPDVDIFIATYNEPEELLRKTINGCKHLQYPDKSKVHVWVCDDKRRGNIKELAKNINVGYFDRPDNKGAKAGNLNCAMARTSAPYIVTLDADMIVRSEFLLKTIPYFVYVEKCNTKLPEDQQRHLGLLQTPQCFYDPDVFQYNLYSETTLTNEQDFFYRMIEVSKTSTNSVIYGGSNTILSRKALDDIGGFYTKSITEDFATGLLIESKGYLSLAISEPLASGMTPNNFDDHIKQRTRWGRGVINTARDMKLLWRWDIHFSQKLSYLSSAVYWYSPIKNLIYILSPLCFAVFRIPVFKCNWLEIGVFWLPMFILQYLCLTFVGSRMISLKWSNVYEICVMPFLLMPVVMESFGISKSKFKVTDKSSNKSESQKRSIKMIPFIILFILSIYGIVRVLTVVNLTNMLCMVVILFWLCVNLYTIIMVIFLISGREKDEENDEFARSTVVVRTCEIIKVQKGDGMEKNATTSVLTEHILKIFINDREFLRIGDIANVKIQTDKYKAVLNCIVTSVRSISGKYLIIMGILEYDDEEEYLQILFDRIPTLPQTLQTDFFRFVLFRNLVYRVIRLFSYFYIEKDIIHTSKKEIPDLDSDMV